MSEQPIAEQKREDGDHEAGDLDQPSVLLTDARVEASAASLVIPTLDAAIAALAVSLGASEARATVGASFLIPPDQPEAHPLLEAFEESWVGLRVSRIRDHNIEQIILPCPPEGDDRLLGLNLRHDNDAIGVGVLESGECDVDIRCNVDLNRGQGRREAVPDVGVVAEEPDCANLSLLGRENKGGQQRKGIERNTPLSRDIALRDYWNQDVDVVSLPSPDMLFKAYSLCSLRVVDPRRQDCALTLDAQIYRLLFPAMTAEDQRPRLDSNQRPTA